VSELFELTFVSTVEDFELTFVSTVEDDEQLIEKIEMITKLKNFIKNSLIYQSDWLSRFAIPNQ